MTHEEWMDRAMEEEENKKKEVIAMMTHEEMMNWAWEFIEGAGITEDEAEFQKDPDNIILVDDIYKVRDAYYDDLENGVNVELEVTPTGAFRPVLQDEDVYQFLDRHGIEWK